MTGNDYDYTRFDELQRKLVALWQTIGRTDPGGDIQRGNTIVVVPSLTVDMHLPGPFHQIYEERFLFMTFLLRQPELRMIYVTSGAIQPDVVDYYLDVIPGVVSTSARRRLQLVAPLDGSDKPLVEKLLERPRLLTHIRSLIQDPDRAHLVPFMTTDLERELALALDIPMYAADPRCFAFGTKSGGRRLFRDESVRHPLGEENLHSEAEMVEAIGRMRAQRPDIERVITKLNEGVSGMGNAVVDLRGLVAPGDTAEVDALTERLRAMKLELSGFPYDSYIEGVAEKGAIVEEFVSGEEFYSPSVQMRVSPLGEVQILSTHDQMLGGPSGQSYLGAIFPADPAYSRLITTEAAKVGQRLAREGVMGRFALDFLTVRKKGGEWEAYAIEINLRKGGTTHPFLTLQYLTDGRYDPDEGVFRSGLGHAKYYVASDHVESDAYRALTPADLMDMVTYHRLHFDPTAQTGVVMHIFSGVAQLGRLGLTAIHNSPEEARALYDRFVAVLDETAAAALKG